MRRMSSEDADEAGGGGDSSADRSDKVDLAYYSPVVSTTSAVSALSNATTITLPMSVAASAGWTQADLEHAASIGGQ